MAPGPLSPRLLQTFQVAAPGRTHWRPATCPEVECPRYLNGWHTTLDPIAQADLVHAVRTSGRRPARVFHDAGLVTFVFDPGTVCFDASTHRIRLDRPELYLVKGGSPARPDPTARVVRHTMPAHWVEHFQEQNDHVITLANRG